MTGRSNVECFKVLRRLVETRGLSASVSSAAPRRIFPARTDRARFPELTAGEAKVLDYLDRALEPDWEIYVQPHLATCVRTSCCSIRAVVCLSSR